MQRASQRSVFARLFAGACALALALNPAAVIAYQTPVLSAQMPLISGGDLSCPAGHPEQCVVGKLGGNPIGSPALLSALGALSPNSSGSGLTGLNASALALGSVPPARLPTPTTSLLGAVFAGAAAAHQWLSAIQTTGALTFTQPGFSDLIGAATAAQTPTACQLVGCAMSGSLNINLPGTGVTTPFTVLQAGLSVGNYQQIYFGANTSSYNYASFLFVYSGPGSTANTLQFGLGGGAPLTINGNGLVTAPSFSVTGALSFLSGKIPVATDGSQAMTADLPIPIDTNPAAASAASASLVYQRGAGYTNLLWFFTTYTDGTAQARITDYLNKSLTYNYTYGGSGDTTSNGYKLQTWLNNLGDRPAIIAPPGAFEGNNLSLPGGTRLLGTAYSQNAGTIFFQSPSPTAPMLSLSGGNSSIEGVSFIGAAGAPAGADCVYVNAGGSRIVRNYFQNCYAQLHLDNPGAAGAAGVFYTTIEDNTFGAGPSYQLLGTSTTNAGIDGFAMGNRFLGAGSPLVSAVKFSGLGSFIYQQNVISLETPSGPLEDWSLAAPLYGGAQRLGNVDETNNTTQPAFSLHGTAAWTLFSSIGDTFTGSGGPAVSLANVSGPTFVGDKFTSGGGTGTSLTFPSGATATDVNLIAPDFETGGSTPVTSGGSNTITGLNITSPHWTSSAPMLDLTMTGTALTNFNLQGGNCGTNATPIKLPTAAYATSTLNGCGYEQKTNTAWTAYTPTITASGTAFPTAPTATGLYQIRGSTLYYNIVISQPSSVGSASGFVVATLPFANAAAMPFTGGGKEYSVTGEIVSAQVPAAGSSLNIVGNNNATAIGANYVTNVSGFYQIASPTGVN